MDIEVVTKIIGEKLFPNGSIDPDGIMYVTQKRIIYI